MKIIIDTDTNICCYEGDEVVLDNWELEDITNIIKMAKSYEQYSIDCEGDK